MSSRVEVLSVCGTTSGNEVVDLGGVLTAGVSRDMWFWVFAIYGLVILGGRDTRVDLLLSPKEFALCRFRLPSFPRISGSLGSTIVTLVLLHFLDLTVEFLLVPSLAWVCISKVWLAGVLFSRSIAKGASSRYLPRVINSSADHVVIVGFPAAHAGKLLGALWRVSIR